MSFLINLISLPCPLVKLSVREIVNCLNVPGYENISIRMDKSGSEFEILDYNKLVQSMTIIDNSNNEDEEDRISHQDKIKIIKI